MMKKTQKLFPLLIFSLISFASAYEIEDLEVEKVDSEMIIKWDDLPSEVYAETEGYALQWGTSRNEIRIDKPARNYLTDNGISLRATDMDRNVNYYYRVYTWVEVDGNRYLTNPSEIVKWRRDSDGTITTEIIEDSDPSVYETPDSNSSSDEEDETVSSNNSEVKMLAPVAVQYDTFVDFRWSKPYLLTPSRYDGFVFEISEDSDFDDIEASIYLGSEVRNARFEGLKPDENYYIRGSHYKLDGSQKEEGEWSDSASFETIEAIVRDGSTRASRNIIKKEDIPTISVDLGNKVEQEEVPRQVTEDNSYSLEKKETVTEVVTFTPEEESEDDIRNQIAQLEREIEQREAQVELLKSKLPDYTGVSEEVTEEEQEYLEPAEVVPETINVRQSAGRAPAY